ncbi:hypothetical protein [Mucilaginibacter lappiensis]|uniref:DUF922 domain-containing protein n=1 Tax=Mucilaginibacter lappiensis TaxID=354630 RepID=A0A841JJT3_9SPHI|nr:hypothetical protein [Mucilaginibacter lappiensis]MBB6131240.1 hypothetical protein [Mucilaginibacter lappiensis]
MLLIIVLVAPSILKAQKITGPLVLNNERLPVTAKEFYVAGIVDNRPDRTAVAWLVPPGPGVAKYTVDLKGGALASIKQFVNAALPPDKTLRPVIFHIEKFRLDETLLPGNHVEGKLKISLSFYLQRDGQYIHLTDYNGSAGYNRLVNQEVDIEMVLRHALEYSLTFFNSWINNEAGTNIKLARDVKIIFTDYHEEPEGDTIYYSPKRRLIWDDFKAKPLSNSRFGAEVLPSIGYNEDVSVSKSTVNVHLSLKAFVPKSACWVKTNSENAYSLNHEQRHFDIVKIIIEGFKQKLKAEKFTVDNYDGPINVAYLESFHEMNVMQDEYDTETSHGMNVVAQEEWNKKIDKELVDLK